MNIRHVTTVIFICAILIVAAVYFVVSNNNPSPISQQSYSPNTLPPQSTQQDRTEVLLNRTYAYGIVREISKGGLVLTTMLPGHKLAVAFTPKTKFYRLKSEDKIEKKVPISRSDIAVNNIVAVLTGDKIGYNTNVNALEVTIQ